MQIELFEFHVDTAKPKGNLQKYPANKQLNSVCGFRAKLQPLRITEGKFRLEMLLFGSSGFCSQGPKFHSEELT